MALGAYRFLFQPLQVGSLRLSNRIVFCAHLTNFATEEGMPSAAHVAYYAARAAGGAGLIITEEHSTHPTDWPYEKLIHGFNPEVVPAYRAITDAVHAHDVPILAQINHNGGQASSLYSRLPVWAPSPVPDPLFREVPKAIEEHEIDEVVAGYATVAAHAVDGGFDGVELQCSHSSIVRGFLSAATNHRSDAWGGPLENRARLLLRIVDAVRETLGPKAVLGVRLCGDELLEGGITLDEAVAVAKMVDACGRVDYINTSIGVATASLYMIEASMAIPPGYSLHVPSAIRGAVSLPVVGVGRFKDPSQAERALQAGYCDLVGVVRGQIADPDFARKAHAGRATSIRTCLSCNQECVGRMGLNRWLGCIENPRAGREHLPAPRRSGPPRRVLVVGAGPAGLQAAVTCAELGHQVTLCERESRTGGQIPLASSVPSRAELLDLVRNLTKRLEELPVALRLDQEVDLAYLKGLSPEVVVLACGSRPARPWWAGESPQVVDVRHVLDGTAAVSGEVLVVDELGFHQATSVAELLAERGAAVEVVTPAMVVGQDLGVTLDLETWTMRAHRLGISTATELVPMGVAQQDGVLEVELLHHPTDQRQWRRCDWVVVATHPEPVDELYQPVRSLGLEVHRIGDCLAPRRAHAAIVEGHKVASKI